MRHDIRQPLPALSLAQSIKRQGFSRIKSSTPTNSLQLHAHHFNDIFGAHVDLPQGMLTICPWIPGISSLDQPSTRLYPRARAAFPHARCQFARLQSVRVELSMSLCRALRKRARQSPNAEVVTAAGKLTI